MLRRAGVRGAVRTEVRAVQVAGADQAVADPQGVRRLPHSDHRVVVLGVDHQAAR